MVGMLQILTYLLAFYLVIKGVEILQIGLASNRQDRSGTVILGVVVLLACLGAAVGFTVMQDAQARFLSSAGSTSQSELVPTARADEAQRSQDKEHEFQNRCKEDRENWNRQHPDRRVSTDCSNVR